VRLERDEMIESDLIFDIGMHRGDDAGFYLSKGFRVLSVEPFRDFTDQVRSKYSSEVETKRLTIIQKALAHSSQTEIILYINKEKDDSHTTRADIVSANRASSIFTYDELTVATTTLSDLFNAYGVPYYLKCDIEGRDTEVLDQLVRDERRPDFVSFEAQDLEILAKMRAAGYGRFQLVNQWHNPSIVVPNPAREGRYAPVQFSGHMSGLFGRELSAHRWLDFESTARLYLAWKDCQSFDPDSAPGWCDFHGTMLTVEELSRSHLFDEVAV
jgi:FkbM family methyltransferase